MSSGAWGLGRRRRALLFGAIHAYACHRIRDRQCCWMTNCYLAVLEQKWSWWEAVVDTSASSSRVHYLFIWIDELMTHGLRYRRHLVIVDKEHWAEVKGWQKHRYGVDQAKSRRRHHPYYWGHLLIEFEPDHGLAAEKSDESGGFKAVIDQTSCFSKTTGVNNWVTRSWHSVAELLFYHFDLIWWMERAEECQSQRSSFNHHKFPPPIMRIEMREWVFPFKCDQVSSQLLRCAGLSKVKRNQKIDLHHIFWSNHNEIKD